MSLEKALQKGSMSAVIKAYVNMNPNGVTVEQMHEFLFNNGMDKEHRQVYTTVQTMASTGKIARLGKGLFGPSNSTVPVKENVEASNVAKEANKVKVKEANRSTKVSRVEVPVYSNEDVFVYLIEQLGEPRPYDKTMIGHNYVLLGEASGEHLINRYRAATGKDPVFWSVNTVGPNAVVIFLDA